ncbi:MAG: flagellar assembly protein FliW [Desulfovibrionaceae bacterium]
METNKDIIEVQSRFGNCTIKKEECISFPEGLIGLPKIGDCALLYIGKDVPFLLLQSIADKKTSFLLTNPLLFMEEYELTLSKTDKDILKVNDESEVTLLTILTVPEGYPESSNIFLLAPIVINLQERVGMQVVNPVYEGKEATLTVSSNTASAEDVTDLHEVDYQSILLSANSQQ